jgi:hypothetical protein
MEQFKHAFEYNKEISLFPAEHGLSELWHAPKSPNDLPPAYNR